MRIKVRLSPDGIKKAQAELQEYKAELTNRLTEFARRLAQEGYSVARVRFASASYPGVNDVNVRIEENGTRASIIAEGSAVAFIEFGTGVNNPEHPSGQYAHGSYGKGHGNWPHGWYYKGSAGKGGLATEVDPENKPGVFKTQGNPPAMAMWEAKLAMESKITQIWREVMGN